MERKRVLREINIDTDMFLVSFEDAARILLEQKDILEKQGWSSISLSMEYQYDGASLIAMGLRLENDEEYNKRLENEENLRKILEKKKKRELATYEKLKAKYGESQAKDM